MINLMVIDDDIQIREGIRDSLDWRSLGIDEVKSYGDALSALKEQKDVTPGIILSDVRMPGMDGLVFLEKVKSIEPAIKVIMISAFSNFEYLKKSLEHGAQDYELKPLKMSKLNSIIRKTVKIIIDERIKSDKSDQYFHHFQKGAVRQFLREEGNLSGKKLNDLIRYFHLSGMDQVSCLILQVDNHGKGFDRKVIHLIEKSIEENPTDSMFYLTAMEREGQFVFLIDKKYFETNEICRKIWAYAGLIIMGAGDLSLSGGLSELYCMEDIPRAYKQSCDFIGHSAYLGPESLITSDSLTTDDEGNEDDLGGLQDQVVDSFLSGNMDQMVSAIKSIGKWFFSMKDIRQENYIRSMLDCQIRIVKREEYSDIFAIDDMAGNFKNYYFLKDIISHWIHLFSSCLNNVVERDQKHLSFMTIKALNYIKRHYVEDLKAGSVAEHIGKSPNYFSSVFKKELRVSFKEMMNKLRIDEAERLIREENLYIYEVADKVGFKDYAYFYQVFKKLKGYEPTVLRKNQL